MDVASFIPPLITTVAYLFLFTMITASVLQGANNPNIIGSTINAANVIHAHHYHNISAIATVNTVEASVIHIKPKSSTLFTGRKDVLKMLKNHFIPQSTGDHVADRRYFLIYGIGGIGKTQICLKFVEETENSFSKVFWIDASSEETILLSLKEIAKLSGIQASSKTAILRWIGSLKESWLLIFDNADLGPEVVEKFIPPGQSGNILISSRNASLRRLTTRQNSYELEEMEEEDAITLLLKAACLNKPSSSDLEFAKAIVTELCCLPLAVDQAGSSIESGLCNISGYLRLYSSKCKLLLDNPNFRGASKYGQTVYGTWELSFQEIQRRANNESHEARSAIMILKTFAFCHHSNIQEEIFERAALNASDWNPEEEINKKLPQIRKLLDCTLLETDESGQWDSLKFKQGISLLQSFSLIKLGATTMEYSVHPLVHAWSRERLSHSEQDIQTKVTIALLSSSITWRYDLNDIKFRQNLFPHIIIHYEASGKLNMFESYYDDEYDNFALVYSEAGYFARAFQLQAKLVEFRSKVLGKEHHITLNAMRKLANTYIDLGRFMEAVKLEIEVLEISKILFGYEHPFTLSVMQNLATTYSYLGSFVEAEKLELLVLEISKRLLGDEHPDTLSRMQNLANTYSDLGKWTEAEKLKVTVLEMSKRLLGDEHPDTLSRMQNLAITYSDQGRMVEAEKLKVAVLEMSKRILGDEHPDTLSSMQNLATTYQSLGKYVQAEKLNIDVLEMSKRLLGDEHPDTLARMQNLAITYSSLGTLLEAEKLEIEIVEMSRRLLGDEHPDTLSRKQNLATTYHSLERYVEAEKLMVEVLEISKRMLGDEHPSTLSRKQNLATTYHSLERYVEAEKLMVEVLEISKRMLGDEHPSTLSRKQDLATTYHSLERYIEAEKLMVEVLEISKRLLGDEHPDTLSTMKNLANTYSNLRKYMEAEKLELQVLEMSKRLFGDEHPYTLSSMKNLANTYIDLGKFSEAEKLQVQVLEKSKTLLGEEHLDTLSVMHNLAFTFERSGRFVKAERLRIKALDIGNKMPKEDHSDILLLADTYQRVPQKLSKAQVLQVSQKPTVIEKSSPTYQQIDNLKEISDSHHVSHFLGALDALQHLKLNYDIISQCFLDDGISDDCFIILAGFNELLIEDGVGYLQEIHAFTTTELPSNSGIFNTFGKVCSPFPSMIFTPSGSMRPDINGIVGSQATGIQDMENFKNLTISSAVNNSADSQLCLQQMADSTNLENYNSQTSDYGEGSHYISNNDTVHDMDREGSEDTDGENDSFHDAVDHQSGRELDGQNGPSVPNLSGPNDPTSPPNNQPSVIPLVKFDVLANLYTNQSPENREFAGQNLHLTGRFTLKSEPNANKYMIEFKSLNSQRHKKTTLQTPYQQFHLRVAIDRSFKFTRTITKKPRATLAGEKEYKQTDGNKKGMQVGVTSALKNPFGVTLGGTKEWNHAKEQMMFTSRIMTEDLRAVISWQFFVNDQHQQESGLELSDEQLPSVEFEFDHTGKPPLPLPNSFNVHVSSYWSLIPRNNGRISWLTDRLKGKNLKCPCYSNLCHVVAIEVPYSLSEPSSHYSEIHVKFDGNPDNLEVDAPGLVIVSPSVTEVNELEKRKPAFRR